MYVYGERTITRSGSVTAPCEHNSYCKTFDGSEGLGLSPGNFIVDGRINFSAWEVEALGTFIRGWNFAGDMYSLPDQGAACGTDPTGKNAGTFLEIVSSPVGVDYDEVTTTAASPGAISAGGSGEWEIECTVEQCIGFVPLDPDDPIFPLIDTKILDAPAPVRMVFYERYKPGSTYSVTAEYGDCVVSASGTITGGGVVGYAMRGRVDLAANDGEWPETAGTGAAFAAINGFDGDDVDQAFTFTQNNTTIDFDSGPRVQCAAAGGVGWVEAVIVPRKQYALSGVVRAMEHAYPDAMTVNFRDYYDPVSETYHVSDVGVSSGAFGASGAQYAYLIGGVAESVASPVIARDQFAPVACRLDSSALSAAGEDTRLHRCLFRGHQWDAMTLEQAATTTIDGGSSLTPSGAWEGEWTGSGDVSPSVVSGAVRFDSAGGGGTLSRDFTDTVTLGSYRWLRIRVRSVGDDGKPLKVSIGGKEWAIITGTGDAWVNADLDLCGPDNRTETTDTDDTIWPLDWNPIDLDGPKLSDTDGPYWGIEKCDSITFGDLASGVVYEIDSIALRWAGYARASFLPTFYRGRLLVTDSGESVDEPWPVREYPDAEPSSSLTSEYYARRFLLGDTDGRQSLEIRDSGYAYTYGGLATSVIYQQDSIAGLIASVNEVHPDGPTLHPGWEAVDLKTPSGCAPSPPSLPSYQDCFLASDLPAVFLFGAGAMVNGTGWTYGFDLSVSGATTIPAQLLVDEVDWFGEAGDVFGFGGGSDRTILLRAASILRGQAHGLVLATDKEPADPSVTVEIRDGGGNLRGTGGSSTTDGAYQTGLDYTKSVVASHTVKALFGTDPSAAVPFYARKRHRVVFVVDEETGQGISQDVAPSGRHVRAETRDGNVWVGFRTDWAAVGWDDADTGIEGDFPCVRFDPASPALRLWLSYVTSGGAVTVQYSDDDGGSWNMGFAVIGSGWDESSFDVSPWGWQVHAGLTSGGAIEVKTFDSNGTELSSDTAVASGAEPGGIAVAYDPTGDRWFLMYRGGGGAVSVVTSQDAVTWT